MLKFFFRKQVEDKTPEVKYNEQSDPYLERLIRELLLQKKEESVKLLEQQTTKETE